MDRFQDLIRKKASGFTKSQKTVAEYILAHLDSIPFFTLVDLANKIDVSTTTVIRFARVLGFDGYMQMQSFLQDELRRKIALPKRLESMEILSQDDLFSQTAENDIQNIRQTLHAVSENVLQQARELLCEAETVYILGLRTSYALAYYSMICLGQIRPNVRMVHGNGQCFPEELISAAEGDVCIAYLFPRYAKSTISLINWLRGQNVKVILVTSTNHAAVDGIADVLLPCEVSGISLKNSYVAPVCLINYLCAAMTIQNKDQAGRMLKKAEDLLKNDLNIF